MGSDYIRLNLASAIFPFFSEMSGRTIIMPGSDENFDRYNAANTTPDKGVPQVFYMHNVVPTSGGFQSIGYDEVLNGLSNATDFDTCFPVLDPTGNTFLFVPGGGKCYVYDGNIGQWVSLSPFSAGEIAANTLVTTALVSGTTYIFFAGIGCFTYDSTSQSLVPVTLTGLTIANTLAICAANGYLIACSKDSIAWSSLTDPTNFTPNIQTGAGGGAVQDAKGPIKFIVSIPGGFLIYCEKNVVGASYTANTNFPYIIVEVVGSGGVNTIDNVGYQGNLPYHVAMTSAGIQQVSLNSAIPTMPEVSEFLTSQIFEDFDEDAVEFSSQYVGSQLTIKIASVSTRFIVISYGVAAPDFTHAIIYDIELNRYGKLRLPHRGAFSFINPAPHGLITYAQLMNVPIYTLATTTYEQLFDTLQLYVTPKQNLAFLQQDGTVQLVDFEIGEQSADGVFIIGKFQHLRNNVIVHHRTDVESVTAANNCKVYLLPTFDGKDFAEAVPTVINKTGSLARTYAKRTSASNISVCLIGAFNLTSMVFNYTVGGSR